MTWLVCLLPGGLIHRAYDTQINTITFRISYWLSVFKRTVLKHTRIGHFRVPLSLSFEVSLSAKFLL